MLTTTSPLGKTGVIASLLTLATSPMARRLLQKAGGSCLRALSWLGRTAYSGIDRGLRLFGKAGHRAAGALFALVVTVGGRVAAVATPVVRRIARFADPQTPHIRVLAGISRSYLLHRALQQLISDLLIGQALQLELGRPALARRGQGSVAVPAVDSWKHNRLKRLRGHAASPFLVGMRRSA